MRLFAILSLLAFVAVQSQEQPTLTVRVVHPMSNNLLVVGGNIQTNTGILNITTIGGPVPAGINLLLNEEDIGEAVMEVFHPGILATFNQINVIRLNGIGMLRLAAQSFGTCAGILTIDFARNSIAEIPANAFANCGSMGELDLSDNAITTLTATSFTGLTNLRELKFERAQITTLNTGIFAPISNLQSLYLGGNTINEIQAGVFPASLRTLSLYGNQFTELPSNAFSNLVNLESIYLEGNTALTALPIGLFIGLIRLEVISLSDTGIVRLNANSFGPLPFGQMQRFYIDTPVFDELDPQFFTRFPVLFEFNSESSLCAPARTFNVSLIDFEEDNTFNVCFAHWFVSRQPEPPTTTPAPPPESGSEIIKPTLLVLAVTLLNFLKF